MQKFALRIKNTNHRLETIVYRPSLDKKYIAKFGEECICLRRGIGVGVIKKGVAGSDAIVAQ